MSHVSAVRWLLPRLREILLRYVKGANFASERSGAFAGGMVRCREEPGRRGEHGVRSTVAARIEDSKIRKPEAAVS